MSAETMKTIANRPVCVLCGGDGFVSPETARQHGRSSPDTTCPCCNGSGVLPGLCRQLTREEMAMLAKDEPGFVREIEDDSLSG